MSMVRKARERRAVSGAYRLREATILPVLLGKAIPGPQTAERARKSGTRFFYNLLIANEESPAVICFFMDTDIPVSVKAMGVVITNTKTNGSLTYDAITVPTDCR